MSALAVSYPRLRDLVEKVLPLWVKLGCTVKVLRFRKHEGRVPSLPPLHEAKEVALAAELDEVALGELEPNEVRLLAKDLKQRVVKGRGDEITVSFVLGCPVTREDIERTWVTSAPYGGRILSSTSDPDGTRHYVVQRNGD